MVKLSKAFLKELDKTPFDTLKKMSLEDIVSLVQKANHQYYNTGKPLFNDQLFDLVKAYLEELDPNNTALKYIGAKVSGNKVKLPYFMGSLDKIKTDAKVFDAWKKEHPGKYVVSDKLDGNSGLLYFQNGNTPKLYTRGNGYEGQDVSHILPFLKETVVDNACNIMHNNDDVFAVRGELIISKDDFEKVKSQGANARNMVAGTLNAKIPNLSIAKLVSFVAYEVIQPIMPPSEQHKLFQALKMPCVYSRVLKGDELSLENLSKELTTRRNVSPYEIDGIVVMHDKVYERQNENPSYAFAFKSLLTMEKAEVIVTKIEWNMSKDGIFVPVVHFTPIALDGVVITKAHGFNGKYIKDNSLAAGAVIIIMRSGSVIPYIVETIVKAKEPQMPESPYVWSKSGVEVIATEGKEDLKAKNIEYFFVKIDVKGLSGGLISRLFDAGFQTVGAILNITIESLLKVDGVKKLLATKLHQAITERKRTLEPIIVMDASNLLGRGIGSKKIKLICEHYPQILQNKYIPTLEELIDIKGIEKVTAAKFIEGLPKYFKFVQDNQITFSKSLPVQQAAISETVSAHAGDFVNGKTFVFSGARDEELETFISNNGGKVTGSVSKNTSYLVVKDADSDSTKVQKAKTLQIPLILIDELKGILSS